AKIRSCPFRFLPLVVRAQGRHVRAARVARLAVEDVSEHLGMDSGALRDLHQSTAFTAGIGDEPLQNLIHAASFPDTGNSVKWQTSPNRGPPDERRRYHQDRGDRRQAYPRRQPRNALAPSQGSAQVAAAARPYYGS